jgi:D-alanyl-D-alanine endopeptidase (penicillin-binding protein 7)
LKPGLYCHEGQYFAIVSDLMNRALTHLTRFLAIAVAALLPWGALAADKPAVAKARAVKASAVKAEFNAEGEPNLASSAVMVLDGQTGQTLYSKNADTAHPIASITKLMTAMIVIDSKLDMDEPIALSTEDIDTLKGTRSRLPLGTHFRRDDLVRIALVASDNRAASALGRSYPGGLPAFVEAMNAKARAMGLQNTTFVDSSGLDPHNVSSPQDLAKLVQAASTYPLIREYSTTPAIDVTLPNSKRKLAFVNTNALVRASDWQIGLSKTGYINEAGKCLVMHAMIANQPIVIVLLDSWGKLTRIGDANRIRKWLEKNPSKLAIAPLKAG